VAPRHRLALSAAPSARTSPSSDTFKPSALTRIRQRLDDCRGATFETDTSNSPLHRWQTPERCQVKVVEHVTDPLGIVLMSATVDARRGSKP
jgi:hypothetical protein